MPEDLSLAVIGSGRAAAARLRAIDALGGARLAAQVRRAPPEGGATLESVLDDASIAALVICTPNALHAPVVRRGLEAGKHVAVEYPLAFTAKEGAALFGIARERERVLHVEHIELLSPSQQQLRANARELGSPRGGRVHFRGAAQGWIADEALAGPPALRALARLHRLTDLFGDARVIEARVDRAPDLERLEVLLGFASDGSVTLLEEWGPGLDRHTGWEIECERGRLDTPAAAPPGGLFAEDTECFLERIRSGASSYLSEARILSVLELSEAITREVALAP